MFKKVRNWFDKHPVLGKTVIFIGSYAAFFGFIALICKISNATHPVSTDKLLDDFEFHEGELNDNLLKMQEFLKTFKMIPGEGYWIECGDLGNVFFSQMLNYDEIAFVDI